MYLSKVKPFEDQKGQRSSKFSELNQDSYLNKIAQNDSNHTEMANKNSRDAAQYNLQAQKQRKLSKLSLSQSPCTIKSLEGSSPPSSHLKSPVELYNPISNPIPNLNKNPYIRKEMEKAYKSN